LGRLSTARILPSAEKAKPMPEKFKQAFNVSVGIPAWSLVSFLVGGVFYAGATLNKLNTLLENYGKTELRVNVIAEKQIGEQAAIQTLQDMNRNHDSRITTLERAVIERGK
jgi:hypothetical protein